jgi:dienelactone hydrolase
VLELPVVFHSDGVPLAGRIYRSSPDLSVRQPAAIVIGSWLTVKEQMATTYARRLAAEGYTALTFDFAGFGASQGIPRQAEIPARKIGDIRAAASFLRTVAFVESEQIGCVAICASAQYALRALADGAPIQSFASVAGWYHDPGSIAPFYGGERGVALRLERARVALEAYTEREETVMAPAYDEGNERAGMHFRLDYYGQADRGAVPSWSNQMAEMTWLYWLAFDGLSAAGRVDTPALFIHSDGCAFPEHVREVHARVTGPKELVWSEGTQTDFYDRPEQVAIAVAAVHAWFDRTLRP